MLTRSIKQFLQRTHNHICNLLYRWSKRSTCKSKPKTTARVVLCRWALSIFSTKKQACPRTRIFSLQALQSFLHAPSSLKQSIMSFSFHDELLRGMCSFEKCKITVYKTERTRTRNQRAILLTSGQIYPVITGDSNSFLSVFSKGDCSDINVVKCRLKYFLFT